MSSRRDHPTHATGAHRAPSARWPQHSERAAAAASGKARDTPRAPGARSAQRTAAAQRGAVQGQFQDQGRQDQGRQSQGRQGQAVRQDLSEDVSLAPGGDRGLDRVRKAAAAGSSVGGDGERSVAGRLSMLRYDPYLDGLFTYCLSVMCEHDTATTALGEALVLAERQRDRDRVPAQRGLHRPWLYALARWACLRRLAEQGRRDGTRNAVPATAPHLSEAARTQRRRELAALAWPEAAGTAPEQREALELAVRHGLPAVEVAAVLALSPEAAGALLSHAACEVERTRAALAVVESGGCAAVAGLAVDDQLLLGTAFRRELLRHVDDCAECRRAAERAMAGVSWPGTAPAGTAELAVLDAPRPAVEAAMVAVRRARCQHTPRFDRAGFPVADKDRSARRDRLRSKAITTTVVATVIAAPVFALWAAYRGAPLTGEPDGAGSSSSERDQHAKLTSAPYENAVQDSPHGAKSKRGTPGPYGSEGHGHSHHAAHSRAGRDGAAGHPSRDGSGHGSAAGRGPGRLTVDPSPVGDATLIRLTASGSSAVRWSASGNASWLRLSRRSGVLSPGESTTLRVTVDHAREPAGAWSARIRFAPSGAVVIVKGQGRGQDSPPPSSGEPSSPPPSSGEPSSPPPDEPPPPSEDPSPSEEPPSGSDSPSA